MLSNKQKQFMEAITRQGGGLNIHELMDETGLTYEEVENIIYTLHYKGIQLTILRLSHRDTIKRVYLSPYDETYKKIEREV